MSRFANDVAHYISGLELGLEKAIDALRAIDDDAGNVEHIKMMIRIILTTVPPEAIKGMAKGVQDWVKEIQERG